MYYGEFLHIMCISFQPVRLCIKDSVDPRLLMSIKQMVSRAETAVIFQHISDRISTDNCYFQAKENYACSTFQFCTHKLNFPKMGFSIFQQRRRFSDNFLMA